VHVNDGAAVVAPASVPDDATHAYVRGAGRASLSCTRPVSAVDAPTVISAGIALMPSTTGQTLTVPLICTLPVRAGSRHWILIMSAVVVRAATSNIAEPEHVVAPSLAVPPSEML
jgi:hypothetical protein